MTMQHTPVPEVGQAVRVRNRLATVRAVEPYDSRSPQGRLHIIDLEYLDDFRYPMYFSSSFRHRGPVLTQNRTDKRSLMPHGIC